MGSHSALLGGLDGVTLTIPKDATAGQQQASLNWNIVADPSTTIPDEVVGIPDNNLRTAIKEALGVTNDNQITKANLEKLTEFTAEGKDIVDLKGIEYATNLTKLVLDNNKITNEGIVPAISLAKLVTVEISGNRIMDGKILSDWAPPLISSKPLERINANNQNLGRVLAATNSEDIALLDLKWSGGKETLQMRNLIRNSQGTYSTLHSVALDGSNSGVDFNFIDNQNFQVENIPLGTGSLEYRAAWGTQKLGFSAFVKVDNLDVQIEE